MKQMKFALNQPVKLALSDEKGIVTARIEYAKSEPQYQVIYKSADGNQIEKWWSESAIVAE